MKKKYKSNDDIYYLEIKVKDSPMPKHETLTLKDTGKYFELYLPTLPNFFEQDLRLLPLN